MSIFDGNMPYTNLHELNLDWVMGKVKVVSENIDTTTENAQIATEQAQIATEQAQIATVMAEKLNFINVKEKGAIGDGLTDDSDSIIEALDNYSSDKKIIYFPQGTYLISKPLEVYSNTLLYFDNAIIKILRTDNTHRQLSFCLGEYGNSNYANGYSGVHNVEFYNMKFDGGYNNTFTATTNGGGNIGLNHCSNILFRNCEFYNTVNEHYIDIAGSKDILIDNCYFHDTAVLGNGNYEAINIDWSWQTGFPHFGGYDNTPCMNVDIINTHFENLKKTSCGVGVHAMPTNANSHRQIKITNNSFKTMSRAIQLMNAFDTVISNNNFSDCADFELSESEKFAVWLRYCSGSIFNNNVCRDFIYGVIKVENFGGADTSLATAIQVNDNIMNVINTSLSGTAIRIRKVQGLQMNNNTIRRPGRMALNLSDSEDIEVSHNNFPDASNSIDTAIMVNGDLARFVFVFNFTNATNKTMYSLYGTNSNGITQENYSSTFTTY